MRFVGSAIALTLASWRLIGVVSPSIVHVLLMACTNRMTGFARGTVFAGRPLALVCACNEESSRGVECMR